VRLVGRGGEGEVWEARNAAGELRALKLVRPECLATPAEAAVRGAWLVRISHPALVRVHRSGVLGGAVARGGDRWRGGRGALVAPSAEDPDDELSGWGFVEMDFLDGESLATAPARRDVLVRLDPLAEALDLLHEGHWSGGVPLVHRDVKPANIVEESRGRLVLVDFSTLRGVDAGDVTQVGTPLYAAPEVYEGALDPAADIYSFAATVVALISGLRGRALGELLAAPRGVDLPSGIVRALDPDPDRRPASCRALLTETVSTTARLPLPIPPTLRAEDPEADEEPWDDEDDARAWDDDDDEGEGEGWDEHAASVAGESAGWEDDTGEAGYGPVARGERLPGRPARAERARRPPAALWPPPPPATANGASGPPAARWPAPPPATAHGASAGAPAPPSAARPAAPALPARAAWPGAGDGAGTGAGPQGAGAVAETERPRAVLPWLAVLTAVSCGPVAAALSGAPRGRVLTAVALALLTHALVHLGLRRSLLLAIALPPVSWALLLGDRVGGSRSRRAWARALFVPAAVALLAVPLYHRYDLDPRMPYLAFLSGLGAGLLALAAARARGVWGGLLRLLALPLWLAGAAVLVALAVVALPGALLVFRAGATVRFAGATLASVAETVRPPRT